jgi:hypothetical protein
MKNFQSPALTLSEGWRYVLKAGDLASLTVREYENKFLKTYIFSIQRLNSILKFIIY